MATKIRKHENNKGQAAKSAPHGNAATASMPEWQKPYAQYFQGSSQRSTAAQTTPDWMKPYTKYMTGGNAAENAQAASQRPGVTGIAQRGAQRMQAAAPIVQAYQAQQAYEPPTAGELIYQQRQQAQDAARGDFGQALLGMLGNAAQQAANANNGVWTAPQEQMEIARQQAQYGNDLAEAYQRYEEARKATDWEGRDELIEAYKDAPRKSFLGERDQIREQLEAGDLEAGNGLRNYTLLDRLDTMIGSVSKGIASSAVDLFSNQAKIAGAEEVRAQMYSPEQMLADQVMGIDTNERIRQTEEALTGAEAQQFYSQLDSTADQLRMDSETEIQKAKEGLGIIGQAGVDIGTNLMEMGFDAAAGTLTMGNPLIPMFARVYGQSVGEARRQGASTATQAGYALTKAGIEVATEKMFDVFGILGGSPLDDSIERLVGKLADSDIGRTFLRVFINAQGEGVEELVSGVLDPLANLWLHPEGYGDWTGYLDQIDWADIAYSYIIGSTIGLIGEGTQVLNGENAQKNVELRVNQELEARAGEIAADQTLRQQYEQITGTQLSKRQGKAARQIAEAYKAGDTPLISGEEVRDAAANLREGQDVREYVQGKRVAIMAAYAAEDTEEAVRIAEKMAPDSMSREQLQAIVERTAPDVAKARVDENGALRLPESASNAAVASLKTIYAGIDSADQDARDSFALNGLGAYNLGRIYGGSEYAASVLQGKLDAHPEIRDQLQAAFDAGLKERTAGGGNVAQASTELSTEDRRYERRTGMISQTMARRLGVNTIDASKLTKEERQQVAVVKALGKALNLNIAAYDSRGTNSNMNGVYRNGTIYLDIRAKDFNGGSLTFTAAHEITHLMKRTAGKEYAALQNFITDFYFGQSGRQSWDDAIAAKIGEYARMGVDLTEDAAADEVIAESCEDLLTNSTAVRELARKNMTLAQRFKARLDEFVAALDRALKSITGDNVASNRYATALRESRDAMQKAQELWDNALKAVAAAPSAEQMNVDNADNDIRYSIRSTSSALGVQAYKDPETGLITFWVDGKPASHITAEHIRDHSGIGLLITTAVNSKFITGEEAKSQYEAAADLMNMIMKTNDPEMTWAWAGASIFSALKKNSDGQYGTTIDFTTVCRKTQEMVTAMSTTMKDLGRGLTKEEVTRLQYRVSESGAEVPCPVCYVFSRWAGIGGMLDNIREMQERYGKMGTAEVNRRVAELEQQIIDRGFARKNKRGKWNITGSNVTELLKQKDEQHADLTGELERLEMKKQDSARQAELRKQIKELDIDREMLGEWTWVKKIMSRADYKPVPNDILFDLNAGKEFAQDYPAVWLYRTTRGPSSGKAILPYSDMRLGDIILGATRAIKTNTVFVDEHGNVTAQGKMNDEQRKAYESALARTAAQNLIGGQRFQSTSDFRYEYALDYIQSFWELQALGSKLQTYTKVVEYADLIATIGGDVNLSVMPKGRGYQNGKLVYSNVTGMNIDAALEANAKFDNAQLILVGINDQHILLALDDNGNTGGENVGFVIPYHTSGASIENFISELVQNLGETFTSENYQDYSEVQTDTQMKDATEEQKHLQELRRRILTGKVRAGGKTSRNAISAEDLQLIRGSSVDITGRSFEDLRAVEEAALSGDEAAMREYLSWSDGVLNDLYEKMYHGAEKATILNSSQAAAIMPHEYWNADTTRANAYVNGFIFRSYCQRLGLHPRFTGWSSAGRKSFGDFSMSTGYWKTLIDRPMYANDGTYREQQRINVTNFDNSMLTSEYAKRTYPNYRIQDPVESRAQRVGRDFARELQGGEDTAYSLRERDNEYLAAVERGDMETAQRMVDEAAKAAGAISENGRPVYLYHGTKAFGFTSFDLSKMDDRQSIFLTDSLDVAKSYSGTFNVRSPRGRAVDGDVESMSLADAVEAYNKLHPNDKPYRVVDRKEMQQRIDELLGEVKKSADAAERLLADESGAIDMIMELAEADAGHRALANMWLQSISAFNQAKTASELRKTYDAYTKANDLLISSGQEGKQGSIIRQLLWHAVNVEGLANAPRFAAMFMDNLGKPGVWDGKYYYRTDGQLREMLKEELDETQGQGNYGLYAFTKNLLAVDAAEKTWDSIPFIPPELRRIRAQMRGIEKANRGVTVGNERYEKLDREFWDKADELYDQYEINVSGWSTTRAIAAWAKANGYDGVKFEEVIDVGEDADDYTSSNVYVIFDSNQAKSADPVTYDNDGNVIPLSQRFNRGNEDIRYSLRKRDDEYMRAVERGDKRYAGVLVREAAQEAGYTVEGYHGTRAFGFTIIDTGMSDDALSFFVTNDLNTARTYSATNRIREINDRQETTLESIMEAEDNAFTEAQEAGIELATVMSGIAGIQGWADVGEINKKLTEIANKAPWTKNIDAVQDELLDYLDDMAWDLFDQSRGDQKGDAEEYDVWTDSDEGKRLWDFIDNAVAAYISYAEIQMDDGSPGRGNYHVFINPTGLLTINCKGKKWNAIDGSEPLPETNGGRYWTTRSVSKWAKEHGYTGVLFRNIIDDGGKGGRRVMAPADVYALFNPQEQVKSADPVTYDDDGNVIPLSQRFNPEEEDIRYSLRDAERIGFDTLIDQYYKKTIRRANPVYIGSHNSVTDPLFKSDAPLIITGSDLTKATREKRGSRSAHSVPESFIRALPKNIDLSCFGYTEDRNGVPSFTDVVPDPKTGKLYVVGGALNAEYEGRKVNRVLTIYEIEHPEQFLTNEKKHLVTTDKNRAQEILEKAGIQSPALQNILNSMRTVSQSGPNVNSKAQDGTFSLRDVTDAGKELKELRETTARLQRLLNREGKETASWRAAAQKALAPRLWEADAESLAKTLRRETGSTMEADEITATIRQLGRLAMDENSDLDTLFGTAEELAERLVDTAEGDIGGDQETYDALRNYFKGQRIYFPRTMRGDLTPDAWNDYRRSFPSFVNIVASSDNATPIDTIYQELQDMYGSLFPDTIINQADQLARIKEVLDRSRSRRGNPFQGPDRGYFIQAYTAKIMQSVDDSITRRLESIDTPTKAQRAGARLDEQSLRNRATIREQGETIKEQNAALTAASKAAQRQEQENRDLRQEVSDLSALLKKNKENTEKAIQELKQAQRDREQGIRREMREEAKEKERKALEHGREILQRYRLRRDMGQERTTLLNVARRLDRMKTTKANRDRIQSIIGDLDLVSKGITGKTVRKLEDLQEWYNDRVTNDPDFIRDERTEAALQRLKKKHISDMDIEDVRSLTSVLRNIENEIRTERSLIDKADRRNIYELGTQIIEDIEATRGIEATGARAAWDKLITTDVLSPEREARRLTGYLDNEPLADAVADLSRGQRVQMDYQRRAQAIFQTWVGDRELMKAFTGKNAKLVKVTGYDSNNKLKEVQVTPAMRMSMVLASRNNDSMRHITEGGYTIPDMDLYRKGKIQEAFDRGQIIRFTRSQIQAMVGSMSAKEMAFAKAVHDYFNGMSREEINAVSEKLKGYSIAEVEDYFPINTDKNFTRRDFESVKFDGTIEGMGFTKERIHATNPIMLEDVTTVLNRAIGQHAKYVGLAIAVRNINKLMGVSRTSFDEEGNRVRFDGSIQQALRAKWGSQSAEYIEKLMSDIQSGKQNEPSSIGKLLRSLRSNYAGAVLSFNAGVAVKQAASYPTAAAVVGYDPLIKALASNEKVDDALIAKYTPLLWYRSLGFSSQELGELRSQDRMLPKWLNWIQGMDVATTKKLWTAAEFYVRDNNKALQRGTDAYYQEVARVYNRIIEETQPNYTVMQRPQVLRSQNELTKALNMFKTQPFQNFNILYDALSEWQAKSDRLRQSNTEANRAAAAEARQRAVWAISSQVMSSFVFAAMQFLWDAFRGKTKKYKDDEDEWTLLAWMKGMGLNMLGNAGGMIPFGGTILEWMQATTDKILKGMGKDPYFDQTFYGLEAGGVSAINDAAEGMRDMLGTAASVISGNGGSWETNARKMWNSISKVSQLLGIPVNNLKNLLEASAADLFKGFYKASGREFVGQYYAMRITEDPASNASDYYKLLYRSSIREPESYKEIYRLMIDSGKFTEEKIKAGMEKLMKQAEGVSSVKDLSERWTPPT